MTTRSIVPRADSEGGIGTTLKRWANGWFNTMLVESLQIDQTGAADGDMWYRASSIFTRLAKGSANYKMFMNAGGTAPEWAQGIKVITSTRDMTAASGDVAYTGVGFKPSLIIFQGAVHTHLVPGWGVVDATSKHFVSYDNVGNCYRAGTDWAFLIIGGPNYQGAILKTFDADGFTLTWTKSGSPSGTITFSAKCFR